MRSPRILALLVLILGLDIAVSCARPSRRPHFALCLGGAGDDKRLGVIRGQQASVRTGGLTGSWAGVGGNFTEIRVNSGRFAVRNTAGQIAAKVGALNGSWINYPGTALSVWLN